MFNEDADTRQNIKRLQKNLKKSPLLFARLGECYLKLGNWENAEKVLRQGISENPDYTTGYLMLAEGYLYSGLPSDAREYVQEGLKKDSSHLGLLHLLEIIEKQAEDETKLRELRETIQQLDPFTETVEVSSRELTAIDRIEDKLSDIPAESPLEIPPEEELETNTSEEAPLSAETTEPKSSSVNDTQAESAQPETVTDREISKKMVADMVSPDEEAHDPDPEEAESLQEQPKKPGKKLATKTLGELYVAQNKYDEAIEIFDKLLEDNPDNVHYKKRLEELKKRRDETLNQSVGQTNE